MLIVDPSMLTDVADKMLIELLKHLSSKVGALTVTSFYREGDKGVHGTLPCRGIDVRCRDGAIGRAYAKVINNKWAYDPSRPEKNCALVHDVGFGIHLHLQVHPNTIEI